MKILSVGYNVVERASIGKKFEEFDERISVVDFLRRLRRKQKIPRKIAILGLDFLLFENKTSMQYIRKLLSNSTSYFFETNPVIVFIVGEKLSINRKLKIRIRGEEIDLYPLFGNRLTQKDIDWFYSPFNI